jgi:hypothetical protein
MLMRNEMRTAKVALWIAGCMLTALGSARGQAKYPAWNYPMSYDSIKAAPKNHKLLYEDDRLRFIEVTIAPNEKEPMNGDPYPSVYMYESAQPDAAQIVDTKMDPSSALNGQGAGHGTAPPGEQFPTCDTMAPRAPHQIANHSTIPVHFYVLDLKRLDGADLASKWKEWYPWMVGPIPEVKNLDPAKEGAPFSKEWPYPIAMDSVKAAPNNHRALFADTHVRLVEVTERPESQENLHGHPYRSVFINNTIPSLQPAPAADPTVKTPLGRPGPYHKGESGDYQWDANAVPWLRGSNAEPPAGMVSLYCRSAMPQTMHAHINGSAVPAHFYRVEFLRADWH